ncbi:response regulator [Pantanalinema sp. GBBB05]|uniref:response regulator n=1 Tax=Pantanalinema sp. GBBB05 TaxID=2604139 RepID=UPI001D8CD9E8|nr:response regulator [Pantanalinema sp. GBBB05]
MEERKLNDALTQFDTLTVLLVETNTNTVGVLGRYLEIFGAAVVRAVSMPEVEECLSFITPDVVMTNVQLEKANGLIVLTTIREHERGIKRPQIPIIAIVDYSDVEGEIALSAGFQAYIRTPIEPIRLYATMRQFV